MIYLFIFFGLIVFLLDSFGSLGFAEWLAYVILLFFYSSFDGKKYIFYLAAFYSLLMIPGYYFSLPLTFDPHIQIINRVGAAVFMLIICILGLRENKAKKISSDILNRIKDLFIALDRKFRVDFINKSGSEFLSHKENLIGKDFFELIPEHNKEIVKESVIRVLRKKDTAHLQLDMLNSKLIMDLSFYGSEKGVSILGRNVTESVLLDRKLRTLLMDKDLLIKEIQHRTKNNFQLILSLLNLQIDSISDELSQRILNETRSRINSISLLYDKLYSSRNIATVDLGQFITDIITNMESANNFGVMNLTHSIDIEQCRIGIGSAIPLGLIINEFYTNSLKYAFSGTKYPSVSVQIKFKDDNSLYVKYKDNGKGLPENFDPKSGTLGNSIISAFVNQLHGTINYMNDEGAEFEMLLKISKVEAKLLSELSLVPEAEQYV